MPLSTSFSAGQQNNSIIKFRIDTDINLLWFSKREIKAALKQGGKDIQKEARRLIASRAISAANDFPGYDSGAMSKSIKIVVGSGGGYVRVMPYKTPQMGDDYYPAFLYYGTSRGLKPRKDFMQAALQNKQYRIRRVIRQAFLKTLRAKPVGKY